MTERTAPDAPAAAEALARASQSSASLRRQSQRTTLAVACFSLASAIAVLLYGFLPLPTGLVLGLTLHGVAVAALTATAVTARATVPDFGRRYLLTIGAWTVLYAGVILGGFVAPWTAPAWFWILGAVLVALPGIGFAIVAGRGRQR